MTTGLFTGQGPFSHINENLLTAIRAEQGPMHWFDARTVTQALPVLIRAVPSGLRRDPLLAKSPRRLYRSRIQTNAAFDAMSSAAQSVAAVRDAAYVLQTQGMFNARRDGRPFFIYTDFTELANNQVNRRYRPAPESWLVRERQLYADADRIFAASRAARDSLVADYGVAPDKLSLVQTGLNIPYPNQAPAHPANGFNVLFVGVDWNRKGGPDMLTAFQILRKAVPGARLRIAGTAARTNAGPGVSFLGKISPAEVSAEMKRATVFCLPALHEPAGIAYSEASAWGLPVVASTAGNISDRVLDGQTGILVNPGDIHAIAGALITLANDVDLRNRMGQAGHTYTLSHFTWARIAARMCQEILALL